MLTVGRSKSKRIAIAILIAVGLAGAGETALGGEGGSPASGEIAAKSQPAADVPESAASPTAVPNLPLVLELKQLRESVEAQSQKLAEHTQELDDERAALRDELNQIAMLEEKLGVVPPA